MIKAINITLSVLVALCVGCAALLLLTFVGSLVLHALALGGTYLLGHS